MSIDLFPRDKWLSHRDVAELFVCHDDGGYSSDDDAATAYAQTFTTPEIVVTPGTAPGNAYGWGSLSDPAGALTGGLDGGGGGVGGGQFGDAPSFDPAALYATGYPLADVANFGNFGFGRPAWAGPGVGSYPFGPHGEYGPAATSVWNTAQPTQAYRGADLGRYESLPALDPAHLLADPALVNMMINPRNQGILAGGIGAAAFHGLTARGPSVGGHADFDLAFNPNASPLSVSPTIAVTQEELPGIPARSSLAALTMPYAHTPAEQTQSAIAAASRGPAGRSSPEQTDVVPPPPAPAVAWTAPNQRGTTPPPPGTPTQTPQPEYTPPPPIHGLEPMLQASGQQMSDFLRMNPELMTQPSAGRDYVGSMYHGLSRTPAAMEHLASMGLGAGDVAGEMQRAFTNIGMPANITPEDANRNFALHYGTSPDQYAQSLMHSYGLSLPPIVVAQGGGGGGGGDGSGMRADEGVPAQMGSLAEGPWSGMAYRDLNVG